MSLRGLAAAGLAALLLPGSGAAAAADGKVKFKDPSGTAVFSLKEKENGAKLVDGAEKELARLTVKEDGIKIKGPDDAPLGHVTGRAPKWSLQDAAGKTVLFVYVKQADGDYKLEDGRGTLLVKVKRREDGFELKSADGKTLSQLKARDGKLSVRDASDKTLLSTNDKAAPAAAAVFGLEPLALPQKAALFYALNAEESRGSGSTPAESAGTTTSAGGR